MIFGNDHHLLLFFGGNGAPRSNGVSYGHDVEDAWLLHEAAWMTSDDTLLQQVKNRSVLLAEAAAEGLDSEGGLWYAFEAENGRRVREKHGWPQAEAMVGFLNAWQLTGDEKFIQRSRESGQFVKQHILDQKGVGLGSKGRLSCNGGGR